MQDAEKNGQKDFFISYVSTDHSWAEWIAWQIEEAGYSAVLQDWDFRPGSNIILEMHRALQKAKRTIIILSPEYLKALDTHSEWASAFFQDPLGEKGMLVPVKVKECELKGLLTSIIYIDLVGLDEIKSRNLLLQGLQRVRGKPELSPAHPGKSLRLITRFPHFPGISSIIQNIPYRRNRFFTGRESFLENLNRKFKRNRTTRNRQPIAISGLTGIGKTQIAIEYAYRYYSDYHFIFWARATSYDTLFSDLVAIAYQLNLSEKNVKEQEVAVNAVKHWFQTQTRWLLILDDVSSLEIVGDFIHLTKGQILITTQNPRVQEIAETTELEKMEPEEGALFLLRRSNIIAVDSQLDLNSQNSLLAREISFKLDGFPLALDHAGAYIGRTECGLSGYIERYQALRPDLMRYVPQQDSLSVAATLMLSFDEVRKGHPVAAELLQICAFLHPDAIPEEIIIGGASDLGRKLGSLVTNKIKWDESIAELRRYSLVRRSADEKTLTMHGLVQTILKDAMKRSEHHRLAQRTVRIVNRAFPEVEHSSWDLCQRYLPHALVCTTLITAWNMDSIEAAQLLHRAGQYLLERAQYIQAKPLLIGAQTIYEIKLGPENATVAAVLDNLGYLYMQQGGYTAYTDAELLYLQALTIREKILGPEDPKTAQSLNHLGLLYYNQGKFSQAEPLYMRAKEIQEKVPELHSADLAITLNNLAWLYYNLGRYDEAELLLNKALAIQEKPEGLEPLAMAATLNALAMLSRAKGNYSNAESFFQRALKIRERIVGQKHPDVATTLNDLAWLYRTQGKFEQAHDYYKRNLAIREQVLGPNHLHVATTQNDLAILLMDQGKYTEAESLFKRVLATRESILGPEHPNVGTTLYNMGWLYYHQGKYAQAESNHKRALEIRKKVLGREHLLHIARSLNALAEVYRAQGEYVQAEQDYKQALEIREQALGPMHRNVITSLGNLANIYVDQGKYAQAEALYERALALRNQTQELELPRMIIILNNVATFYVEQGKYPQAELLYEQALTLYEKVLDSDHPDVASVLNNLGWLYVLLERYNRAESHLQRAVDARKAVLGLDHPLLGQSYDSLATYYRVVKKYKDAEIFYRQALTIRQKALGSEHPHVAQTHNNLALLYAEQERYTAAEPLLQLALTIRKKLLGPEHPHVAQSLNNLAEVYRAQDNFALAQPLYEEAIKIDEQVLGPEHPHVATVLMNYAALQRKLRQVASARKLENRARSIRMKHSLGKPPQIEEA